MGATTRMADDTEVAEAEMIGQLLDVSRPVDETPTRLDARTAEPRPVRADQSNAGLNHGGIQEASGESGVVTAMEEHDRQPRFDAVLRPAQCSVTGELHRESFSIAHADRTPDDVCNMGVFLVEKGCTLPTASPPAAFATAADVMRSAVRLFRSTWRLSPSSSSRIPAR